MILTLDTIIPALLGFAAGIMGPLVAEKWKGKKAEERKLTSIEIDAVSLQNSFQMHTADTEKRLTSMEERLRSLEINISHNIAVLKVKMPDAPLEDSAATIASGANL